MVKTDRIMIRRPIRLEQAVLAGWLMLMAVSPAGAQEEPTPIGDVNAMLQAEKFVEAEQRLLEIRRQSPNDMRVYFLMGYALHGQERYQEAIPYHLKAASIRQFRVLALYNLACTYARLDDKSQCLDTLEQVVKSGFRNREQLYSDPDFASLKGDPRFERLLPPLLKGAALFREEVKLLKTFVGEAANSEYGWIARKAGDLDGDGAIDFFVTAPAWRGQSGKIYVYSSRSGELLFDREGSRGERLGNGGAVAGDVNGDGTIDLIFGAPFGGTSRQGRAYVLSGADGRLLRTLQGRRSGDEFGYQVCGLGDIDGDGHADVAVSAWRAAGSEHYSGRCHVFSGRTGHELFVLDGAHSGDGFGSALAAEWTPGQADQPGYATLVVGAQDAGTERRGIAYVYRVQNGKARSAFQISGGPRNKDFGKMFASFPGDLDRDGVGDLFLSDFMASNDKLGLGEEGMCGAYSGKDGKPLLILTGQHKAEGLGTSGSDAGDVDGDEIPDLVVGAWNNSELATSAGKVTVFSGVDGRVLHQWTCRQSGDTFGFDATGLGDINGDGRVDFLLTSAWSAARGEKTGRVFILSAP